MKRNFLHSNIKWVFIGGIFLLSLTLLTSCKSESKGPPTLGITRLTDDGGWCWFSDPRAVYYKGKHRRIYSGWVKSNGDIEVASYDLDTKEITRKILWHKFEKDDHDDPAFQILPDGRIQIYFTRHSGKIPIIQYLTKNPEDISSGAIQQLSLNDSVTYSGYFNSYTYVNPIMLKNENNKMYFFWRGMDFKPNVSVSSDLGKTWSKGKIFILPERIYENRRPYVKYYSDGKSVIHIAFTDGHPRDEPKNSIYYMYYKNGNLFNASGRKICSIDSLPVKPSQADKVYDGSFASRKAWIWDVAQDKEGNPVLVYAIFPSDYEHIYYYSKWNGKNWENIRIVNSGKWFPQTPAGKEEEEPNYSAGICLDHSDPNIVYLSRNINGVFEIEKWIFSEEQKSWLVVPITENSSYDQVRPLTIQNADSSLNFKVAWLGVKSYRHFTDYRTIINMK
jgi:hypothetical protein